MRQILLLVALVFSAQVLAQTLDHAFLADSVRVNAFANSGSAQLIVHRDSASAIGVRTINPEFVGNRNPTIETELRLDLAAGPDVFNEGGYFTSFGAGNLPTLELALEAQGRALERTLIGRPVFAQNRAEWVDERGLVWLVADQFHANFDAIVQRIRFNNADVRIGPGFADWLGQGSLQGHLLGELRMELSVPFFNFNPVPNNTCTNPTWPSASDPADVALTGIDNAGVMRCGLPSNPNAICDGPGGNNFEVIIAPSARLQNIGTKEVPWYPKFSANSPPYNNDQHPLLVWNLYRVDGPFIRQIGRSGVKHAFIALNNNGVGGCACTNTRILGRNCQDIYSTITNDTPPNGDCTDPSNCYQGPRAAILPNEVVYARCGSTFDPNCDGNPADAQQYTVFDHRMSVSEEQLDPTLGPNSYLLEAWYLVRDDYSRTNNLGSVPVNFSFSAIPPSTTSVWMIQAQGGDFQNGSALERWHLANTNTNIKRFSTLQTPRGRIEVASTAAPRDGGGWQYRISIFNMDFAVNQTSGSGANIRMVKTQGLTFLEVGREAGALYLGGQLTDTDSMETNDWLQDASAAPLTFKAPSVDGDAVNTLSWGSVFTLEYFSNSPPGTNTLTLKANDAPSESHVLEIVAPGPDQLLVDGFESP